MVERLTEKERIEILMMIGYGERSRTQYEVCHLFNNKYPNRPPISRSTVSKIEQKFEEFGNVRDRRRIGRPKVEEDVQLNVLLALQENPHRTTRELAADNGVCQTSVVKYLKKVKWHPYKVIRVQELNEDDFDRRMEFCEIMMNNCNDDPQLINRILFSDECTFFLNGSVHRQNCRYWASENPHWMMECKTQFPQKVNIWAGIIQN